MDEDQQYITQEGHDKLNKELDFLKGANRHLISSRIERAKDLGDLSENAEYSEAKDEQVFNEGKILQKEGQLKKLVVKENNGTKGVIDLGSKVVVEVKGKEREYTIVSFNEVDPENNMISNESPIGVALIDKRVGDEVIVTTPAGETKYKVLKVS